MGRMYDSIGLPKRYPLETPLSERDIETLRTAYRDALHDSREHPVGWDTAGAEARSRMTTLKAIFGRDRFLDIDAENNPCRYRKHDRTGFVCSLAVAEMKRRGMNGGYSTACHWIEYKCLDSLNPNNRSDGRKQ